MRYVPKQYLSIASYMKKQTKSFFPIIMWQKSNKTEKELFQFGRVAFSVQGAEAFALVLANTPFVTRKSCCAKNLYTLCPGYRETL